jgi:hypothetical protein
MSVQLNDQEGKGKNMKKIAKIVYTAIGGSALLLAGMPPIPANAELAPNCVSLFKGTQIATARNDCKKQKRVRMIWANALDGGCWRVPPGKSFTESRERSARYLFRTPYVKQLDKC